MYFEEHDSDYPIAYTLVEPWYAYLWWPVKNDGANWNCDKAIADLYITVPNEPPPVSLDTELG